MEARRQDKQHPCHLRGEARLREERGRSGHTEIVGTNYFRNYSLLFPETPLSNGVSSLSASAGQTHWKSLWSTGCKGYQEFFAKEFCTLCCVSEWRSTCLACEALPLIPCTGRERATCKSSPFRSQKRGKALTARSPSPSSHPDLCFSSA